VRDAVGNTVSELPTQSEASVDIGMPRSEKLLLGFGIGIAAVLFVGFIFYWFQLRDTWEFDNHLRIAEHCQTFDAALIRADDAAAAQAFTDLNNLLAGRTIERQYLSERVQHVRSAFSTVQIRLETARIAREAQEAEAQRQREVAAETERRELLAREAAAASRPKERYYRDSKGAIISESEMEEKLWHIQRTIDAMPEDQRAKKAYLQGVLRAVEEEWARIKRQGPIER